MSRYSDDTVLLEMFVFEISLYLERLEQLVLAHEKEAYPTDVLEEMFRIMHNIKSSSAMMEFKSLAQLTHALEDFFLFLGEKEPEGLDYSVVSDLVFEYLDFVKEEVLIKKSYWADDAVQFLIKKVKEQLALIKEKNDFPKKKLRTLTEGQKVFPPEFKKAILAGNAFKVTIYFHEAAGLENVRAWQIVHQLQGFVENIFYFLEDLPENKANLQIIREEGFTVFFTTKKKDEAILDFFKQNVIFREIELVQLTQVADLQTQGKEQVPEQEIQSRKGSGPLLERQSIIGVKVDKLDKLMDLVGKMGLAEAMVTRHPELKGLELVGFNEAVRRLRKIINEVQGFVTAMRLVPLATIFQKMRRVVRDLSKSLGKEVELELIGEEIEVDKNIIEYLADPLLHLVRNAVDHGLETPEIREKQGKAGLGKITLEARYLGNDLLIIVKDDGQGLDQEKLIKQAQTKGLLSKKAVEMSEAEIYSLIFTPGFSTKEQATEFSGRGVGMDVVLHHVKKIGGQILLDSLPGQGMTLTLKIPFTLTTIKGMGLSVGSSTYLIPLNMIKECFRPESNVVTVADGQEMILVKGQLLPLFRLSELYKIEKAVMTLKQGILIVVANNEKTFCLFADALLGEQQVVFRPLPKDVFNNLPQKGIVGCAFLADGGIGFILDPASF